MPIPSPADFRNKTKKHSEVREMLAEMAENAASKSDATRLSSLGEWLTEDGKTTLSTLNTSIAADANKLKVIRTIEKIALLNASLSEKFYVQSVFRNQGANGSRIHVQSESQLGTNNRVASLIIADTETTAGIQEYTVDGTGGIKLKILVNWDNFETDTYALNVNLPINNLKFLKEFQNESQLNSVPTQIATAKSSAISTAATDATTKADTAKSEAISASATDATTKANAAEANAKADATSKANTARIEAIAKAATLSSMGEWLTEDGKTTLSTLNTSIAADANKLKVIRTIEKIALLNASLSEKFYVQSVLRNQGANGSRIHVQSESQLGTNNRVASLIIADTETTAGIQEYTVDGIDGIKLKILVNWDNFETNTSTLNVNLPINNLKFLKEFQVAEQIAVAKAEAISAAATDATSKASAAETNAKNYTDQFFNQFLINQGDKWES